MNEKPSNRESESQGRQAEIHTLLQNPLSGAQIEDRSLAIIDGEAPPHHFTPEEWEVVRRMIHATGDFEIMNSVRFSPGAIEASVRSLQSGLPIYADSNMIKAGLSLERLKFACPSYSKEDIFCHVGDADVAAQARDKNLPRSLFALRKARSILSGGIAVFGNAPVALLELNRMIIEDGLRPALVLAAPVGFVHVVESKLELMELNVPCIVLEGRRGGSPLAVSIVHALCTLATDLVCHEEKSAAHASSPEAVILLGHGSRLPKAGEDMRQVAHRIQAKTGHPSIKICNMQFLGPTFDEVFDQCRVDGAKRIIVIPYFLHIGVHMREDIPAMLREKADLHPEIEIILGNNLGYDERLADVVIQRIAESRQLPDIKTMPDGNA
jgi:precorrin isomerase